MCYVCDQVGALAVCDKCPQSVHAACFGTRMKAPMPTGDDYFECGNCSAAMLSGQKRAPKRSMPIVVSDDSVNESGEDVVVLKVVRGQPSFASQMKPKTSLIPQKRKKKALPPTKKKELLKKKEKLKQEEDKVQES